MVEPAISMGVQFADIIAGLIFNAAAGRMPRRQLKAGDDYMNRTLTLTEKHQGILSSGALLEIGAQYKIAEASRIHDEDKIKFRRAIKLARLYEEKAKRAYELAKILSDSARAKKAFSEDVAYEMVRVEGENRAPEELSDAEKEGIHTEYVEVTLDAAQLF